MKSLSFFIAFLVLALCITVVSADTITQDVYQYTEVNQSNQQIGSFQGRVKNSIINGATSYQWFRSVNILRLNLKQFGDVELIRVYFPDSNNNARYKFDVDHNGIDSSDPLASGVGFTTPLSYNGHTFAHVTVIVYPSFFDIIFQDYDYQWANSNLPNSFVNYQVSNSNYVYTCFDPSGDMIILASSSVSDTATYNYNESLFVQERVNVNTNIKITYDDSFYSKIDLNDTETNSAWKIYYYDWVAGSTQTVWTNSSYTSGDYNKTVYVYGYPIQGEVYYYPSLTKTAMDYTFPSPPSGWVQNATSFIPTFYGVVTYVSGDYLKAGLMDIKQNNTHIAYVTITNGQYSTHLNNGTYNITIVDLTTGDQYDFTNITVSGNTEQNFVLGRALHTIRFAIYESALGDIINRKGQLYFKFINNDNSDYNFEGVFKDGDSVKVISGNWTIEAWRTVLGQPFMLLNSTDLTLTNNPPYSHLLIYHYNIISGGGTISINNSTYSRLFVQVYNRVTGNPIPYINIKITRGDNQFSKYYKADEYGTMSDWLEDGYYYTLWVYITSELDYKYVTTFYMAGNKSLAIGLVITQTEQDYLNESYNKTVVGGGGTGGAGGSGGARGLTTGDVAVIRSNFSSLIANKLFMTILLVIGVSSIAGRYNMYVGILSFMALIVYFAWIGWIPMFIAWIIALISIGLTANALLRTTMLKGG